MSVVGALAHEAKILGLTMRARRSASARRVLEAEAKKLLTGSGRVGHFRLEIDNWRSFRAAGTLAKKRGPVFDLYVRFNAFSNLISGSHVRQAGDKAAGTAGWFADLFKRFGG